MVENMEEIRIKIRGRNEKYKFDAIQCIASNVLYPDWWDFKSKEGVKYVVHLISEEHGIKTFGVQTEIDAIIHGWEDFEEIKKKKWWKFW